MTASPENLDLGRQKLGWPDAEDRGFKPKQGLHEETVREMSWTKGEPDWMLDMRLESLRHFDRRPMPGWVGDLSEIRFDDIFDDNKGLGTPEADRTHPAGVTAQRESEAVFHRNRRDLEGRGVVFCDMDTALREYPELVKPHFGTIVGTNDNKFASLNTAVWSGGSFIYVPPGVEVEMPLQAYFGLNAENMGRFERTLIIADEGSKVHHIEGCSAPVYTSHSLRSAVVEIVVKPSARVSCTTIQNWSSNVFNMVTKRARVETEGHMEWIDCTIGSRLTMTYPATRLVGPKASGEVLSVAYAGASQHQDTGARMVHAAPETSSTITSKSVSKDGGRSSYRAVVRVEDDANGCSSRVRCDALVLDDESISESYPSLDIGPDDARIGHEATVSKVAGEQLFYLMSRGVSEQQAIGTVVNGFVEPVTRSLPMEYVVEWSRLIELQMERSVG